MIFVGRTPKHPFFISGIFYCLDLLLNLLGNLIPELNDGLGMHSFLLWGNLYFGDSLWSLERFYGAFAASALVTLALALENLVLTILHILKK